MTKSSGDGSARVDYEVGYGRPPSGSRFVKGRSGNPRGRPKAKARAVSSPFDVIMDQILTIERNGVAREVTPEEALQQALLKKALAGSRPAIRKVLKMIQARQEALAAEAPPPPRVTLLFEYGDPDNANEALLILGIAATQMLSNQQRLKLLPWAVQAALDRRGAPVLRKHQQQAVAVRLIDPDKVVWPEPDRS